MSSTILIVLPPALPAPAGSDALTRFTVTGILVALDAHATGRLGPARLCWELSVRLEQLYVLYTPSPALTRLRWGHRAFQQLCAGLDDRALPGGPDHAIAAAVADLRSALINITVSA